MIYVNSATNTFHLNGKNTSYVFAADSNGFLRHLYFGEKLPAEENLLYLAAPAYLGAAVNFPCEKPDPTCNLNAFLLEFSCGQLGDFRRPSFCAELPNGSRLTDFRYNGYEILQNFALQNLPHARGGETLRVDLVDCANKLSISIFYTVFDDCDVVVRCAEVTNNGVLPIAVESFSSFTLDLPDDNWETISLVGNWACERMARRCAPHSGILEVTSGGRGVSSHCYNPFLALVRGDTTEDVGEALGVNLVYSGSFALSCENSSLHLARLQGGINSRNFRWKLDPDEQFFTPQSVLAYSAEGLGGMSRAFHDFYRAHLVNPTFATAMRPIVANNWEATYFDFDRDKLFAFIDAAAELGVDTFVLDDGWFTNRNDDTNGLGDWEVNFAKLDGGLLPLSERCHSLGLKFGLWFEPEMVSEGTRLFAEHPDWVLLNPQSRPKNSRTRGRNQLVLDFSNPKVVLHIFGKMRKVIAENNVDYIKWDMNRYLSDLYSAALPADMQGEVAHRYVLGVYSLATMLTETFPDLFIEGCSGGGGRFDAGMLYFCPQIWTSDNTDAFSRTFIQHGTSLCYPPSAMSAHFSASPNEQTHRTSRAEARFNVASECSFGYELDLTALTDEQKQQIKAQIAAYRMDERLVAEGDLFRLSPPGFNGLWAVAQVSKDKTIARVIGMYGLICENVCGKLLRIQGLRDDFSYTIPEFGLTLLGKTLRTAGVALPQTFSDFETFAFHLQCGTRR